MNIEQRAMNIEQQAMNIEHSNVNPPGQSSAASAFNVQCSPLDVHRSPLQVPASRRAVLAAVMLTNDALDEVSDLVTADDFASQRHATVYRAMCALATKGTAIDIVTLRAQLLADGDLQRVGGDEAIMRKWRMSAPRQSPGGTERWQGLLALLFWLHFRSR